MYRGAGRALANAVPDDKPASRQGGALRTLRHRNFRLLWFGQLVASVGQQMQQVAIAWQLFNLTDSTFQVGLVAAFGIAPFLAMSFVGGTIADRFDRRRIMLFTQSWTMVNALLLLTATLAGVITPGIIYGLAFMMGLSRSFDGPARQSLIPNLVPRDELANALTMNTMLRQLATVAGPGIGGIVLGLFGVAAAYAVNSLLVLSIIGALLLMDPIKAAPRGNARGLQMALGGLRYVKGEPVVLSILCLDWLVNLLGATRVLLPVFARDILEVGPEGLGLLYAAPAAGAVTGALVLGAIGVRWKHPAVILMTCMAFGAFIVGFGVSTYFPLSLLMLFGTGLMDVIGEVMRSTIVQLRTPDELRGRVTALTIIFTNGGPQLGQLQNGAIATSVGPVEAAVFGGLGVMLSTTFFIFNRHMRTMPPDRVEAPVAAGTPAG